MPFLAAPDVLPIRDGLLGGIPPVTGIPQDTAQLTGICRRNPVLTVKVQLGQAGNINPVGLLWGISPSSFGFSP